jgi:4-amino-4-deoxy-L-arabinose transferase-like glycosyltransferase
MSCPEDFLEMEKGIRDQSFRRWALLLYLLTAVLEGVAAFVYLLRIPGDPNNALLFGMSKTRLVLAFAILVGILTFGFMVIKGWRNAFWIEKFLERLKGIVEHTSVYYASIIVLLLLGWIGTHLIWLSRVLTDEFVLGYLSRLLPIVFWLSLLSWQTILLLPVLRYDEIARWSRSQKLVFRIASGVFILLIILWLVIAGTGFGVIPDANGWDAPGAPVLPYQVWLAWILGAVFFLMEGWLGSISGDSLRRQRWIDVLISVLIYLLTIWVWTNAPMERAYYAPMERAPNFELYPYSDAAMYDSSAQRLLLGEGFAGIPRKPLYAVLLASFHLLAGNEYHAVANLQVLVLACIPLILYWLTKSLHSRMAGLIAAFILILRETNAIALSADIRIVHSKILLSDMPVGLGLVLFSWLFVSWLQDPVKRRWQPLLVGGVFGLSMLIRSNSVIMLAAIIAIMVVIFLRRPLKGLFNLGLFLLGLGLTIAPWMLRSYQLTGRASFNDPKQVAFHAQLYTFDDELGSFKLPQMPGETNKAYLDRLNAHVVDFTLQYPEVVAGFVIPHVLNNQIGMLLNLPMTPWLVQNPNTIGFNYKLGDWPRLWGECCSAQNYVEQMTFWERGWYERLSGEMKILLAFNLLIVAIGLSVAWVKWDIVGWIPLAMSLAYTLSTAMARYSGWRFALPVDWVTFMYYAIGLGQITLWAFSYLSARPVFEKIFPQSQGTWQRIEHAQIGFSGLLRPGLTIAFVLLIVGSLPLIIERSIEPVFSPLTASELSALVDESDLLGAVSWADNQEIQAYLQSEQAVILRGKAFYPRYYPAGEGESGTGWLAYTPRDYDRLGFILMGSGDVHVVMALDNPPEHLPNAAEILLVGCERDDIVDALVIFVSDGSEHTLVRSPLANLSCPDH